jgi:hypothetical protein
MPDSWHFRYSLNETKVVVVSAMELEGFLDGPERR